MTGYEDANLPFGTQLQLRHADQKSQKHHRLVTEHDGTPRLVLFITQQPYCATSVIVQRASYSKSTAVGRFTAVLALASSKPAPPRRQVVPHKKILKKTRIVILKTTKSRSEPQASAYSPWQSRLGSKNSRYSVAFPISKASQVSPSTTFLPFFSYHAKSRLSTGSG